MALHEAEEMSIVDPRQISDADADRIISAFEALMWAEDEADDSNEDDAVEDTRDELNAVVPGRLMPRRELTT